MQRRLAIAAARVNESRIGGDKFAKFLHHAQTCGGVNIHYGPVLDGIRGQARLSIVQETEAAGPPAALGIDVRAGFEQHVEHLVAGDVGYGWRIERADWLV